MHKGKYIHKATKKYYPRGGLFWFECDKYGEQTGYSIFVMKVPSWSSKRKVDEGAKNLIEYLNRESNPIERIGHDFYAEDMELSNVKAITAPQKLIKNRRLK